MTSIARDRVPSPPDSEESDVAGASPRPGWLGGVTAMFRSKPTAVAAAESKASELLAFPSEAVPRTEPPRRAQAPEPQTATTTSRRTKGVMVVIVAGAAVAAAGFGIVTRGGFPIPSMAAMRTGNLTIETEPAGSQVLIDGQPRGTTPLTMAIAPGAHTVTLRSGGDERTVPVTIAAGADVTRAFEMKPREPVSQFGSISVVTDPPGARVTVDGQPRGVSPIVISDLVAREHTVIAANESGSAERRVLVTRAETASLMFSLAGKTAGPVGGWLTVQSPFNVEVVEAGEIVGASSTSRIMLASGRHDLTLTNRAIGYQEARRIDVTPGKTTTVRVEPPRVPVSVNARPWAEVLLDGTSIGQTPISNLLVAVGSHELVFRHPQLGERRQSVVVTANGGNRIAADLTK